MFATLGPPFLSGLHPRRLRRRPGRGLCLGACPFHVGSALALASGLVIACALLGKGAGGIFFGKGFGDRGGAADRRGPQAEKPAPPRLSAGLWRLAHDFKQVGTPACRQFADSLSGRPLHRFAVMATSVLRGSFAGRIPRIGIFSSRFARDGISGSQADAEVAATFHNADSCRAAHAVGHEAPHGRLGAIGGDRNQQPAGGLCI